MLDLRPSLDLPQCIDLQTVELKCFNLDEVDAFYRQTLGMSETTTQDDSLKIRFGRSTLIFRQAEPDEKPFYHFAFNIPKNKFDEAKKWLSVRTEIVKSPDGRDQFHFSSRDADAVYFLDPAGNLVEFIAHHRLKNERPGKFSESDILELCEIGLIVDNLADSLDLLMQTLNAVPYLALTSDKFAAVGDERGFLIAVKRERLWFPLGVRPAIPYETIIGMPGSHEHEISLLDAKARIVTVDGG